MSSQKHHSLKYIVCFYIISDTIWQVLLSLVLYLIISFAYSRIFMQTWKMTSKHWNVKGKQWPETRILWLQTYLTPLWQFQWMPTCSFGPPKCKKYCLQKHSEVYIFKSQLLLNTKLGTKLMLRLSSFIQCYLFVILINVNENYRSVRAFWQKQQQNKY